MKWLTLFIPFFFIGCNQNLKKVNKIDECNGLAEIVEMGFERIESPDTEYSCHCKKGFTSEFSTLINSDSCTVDKAQIIQLLGKPNEEHEGIKYPFMATAMKKEKENYQTLLFNCSSSTKTIVTGKIENAPKNLFLILDKDTNIVEGVFAMGL